MSSDIAVLLQDLESSVTNLEHISSKGAANVTWKFDNVSPRKTKSRVKTKAVTSGASEDPYGRKIVKKQEEVQPGVGAYSPNFEVTKRSTPGFRIVPPSKRATAKAVTTDSTLCPENALKCSSRFRNTPGVKFAGPKTTEYNKATSKAPKERAEDTVKAAVGLYNPNYDATGRRTVGFAFAPPKSVVYKPEPKVMRKAEEEQEPLQVPTTQAIEKALGAIEPRVKGTCAWVAPASKPKGIVTQQGETVLDTDKAWKASIAPTVRGGAAWMPNYYQKKPRPPLPQQASMIAAKPVATPSPAVAPGFAKPVPLTKQLVEHRQKNARMEEQLGPGKYVESWSTFKTVKARPVPQATKKRKLHIRERQPGVGTYNTETAWEVTRPRVKCGVSLGKGPKRFPSPKPSPVKLDSTCFDSTKPSDSPLVSDSDEEMPTPRHESKYDSDDDDSYSYYVGQESKHAEGKYADLSCSSSTSSWDDDSSEDGELEILGKWLDKQKRTAKPREQPGSVWARKSFKDSADARRVLILQKHQKRKLAETMGPAKPLNVRHKVIEPRSDRGTLSMAKADEIREKQVELNRKIQEKVAAQNASKEEKLLAKLGINPDLLEEPASEAAVLSPSRIRGFKYHPPTELPSPVKQVRREREEEATKLGPGTYQAAFHKKWGDESQLGNKISSLLEEMNAAQLDMTSGHEGLKRDAYIRFQDARDQLTALKTQTDMYKQVGRKRVRVKRKGDVKVYSFAEANDPEPTLGPGVYDIPSNLTRFGVERTAVVDFSKMTEIEERLKLAKDDVGENVLDLEYRYKADEYIRPSAPGTRGFEFSKIEREILDQGEETQEVEESKLDLEPNYEYGKFNEGGKTLIPMDKQPMKAGLFPVEEEFEFGLGDEDMPLDLSPTKAKEYVAPRVKTVDLGAGKERFPQENVQEEYKQAVYEPNLDAVKPRSSSNVPDFSKGDQQRFEGDTGDESFYNEPDYDVDRGLSAIKPKPRMAIVNMDSQLERFEEKKSGEGYIDAVYEGAEGDVSNLLGGRNSKGVQRTLGRGKATVDMSKGPKKGISVMETAQQQPVLDLDVEKAENALRARSEKSTFDMSTVQPRWASIDAELEKKAKERPLSPMTELIDAARLKLSIQDKSKRPNPKGNMDMSKWTGRQEPGVQQEVVALDIDATKGRDAPSQNPRVRGGKLPKGKRSGSPSTRYAKEKAMEGNVLVLDPKKDPIEKNLNPVMVSMGKQTGRGKDDTPDVMMNMMVSPPKPDLARADEALKPRVLGAVGLKPKTDNTILKTRRQADLQEAKRLQRQVSQQIAAMKKKAKLDRQTQIENIKGGGNAKKKKKSVKQNKKKNGVVINRAVLLK